ncbi:MAG: hypothetical protein DWI10_02610 [Planctomycetota bacterium]|jgi:hypothetical protein|nr:MAG: hypothetical protein DWI10_02610 [Planctomycetota bacterium]
MQIHTFLSVTSMLVLATIASADIGFPAAVTLCRDTVVQGTLLGIEQRERDNVWGYEGDLYDAALTTNWGPRFHRDTGAFIRLDVDAPDESDISNLQAIFAQLPNATLDFADAETAANTASSRTDVQRIQFDMEAGILAFQVEYFDNVTKIYIDSVTGGVIPHHGAGDDIEATLPPATLAAGVALAEATMGAGWHAFKVESDVEDIGTIVQVRLFNLKTGMLAEADVVGTTVMVTEFSPSGSQASKVAALQANWSAVTTDLAAALAATEVAYPAAGVNDVELEVETEKSGTTIFWRVAIVTVDLIELDYWVDATTPSGGGLRFATAPVNALAGDIDGDGVITAADLSEILALWGAVNPPLDLDNSGFVGAGDLSLLLANWK